MSKYDALKKDAQIAAQAGTSMIGLKILTLLVLIEERDALRLALKSMLEQFTKTPSSLSDSRARCVAHSALALGDDDDL